ncbi:hypothetical protein CMT41_12700 [Colwellia sp. MT41]|uniref:response regulator n=1 Tax=Colwellia sp. MT41 TaxID=58049 RepID=UPI000717A82D|nr:response regulator [Colwellia sp. MT41]ALO35480.1 hypothetical protein CMT41_12700 [Colwellia sp. MT41]
MSAYFTNNSNVPPGQQLTDPNASPIFFDRNKKAFLVLVLVLCLLPSLLNVLGIDFSSNITALNFKQTIEANHLFYALAGALHHTLLEWSAVVLALLTFILALVHYRIHRDVAIPIMGMAIFCAGSVDAFHTLAATRIISAQAENTDFIPFTWALSRIFNACIMITGTLISFMLYAREHQADKAIEHSSEYAKNKRKSDYRTIFIIGLCFITLAYVLVHVAANSTSLPQTMFKQALITRPYDVLPLGLFIFAGSLFINLYRQFPTIAKYGLLLSVIPEVTTQIHMAFGSTALFDNHFNIAHGLKILAYGCAFLGLLFDLKTSSISQLSTGTGEKFPPISPLTNKNDDALLQSELLDVGHARHSISMQIPIAAFVLVLSVATLVSFLFYFETERLLIQQTSNEVAIESKLVEPMIKQLYRQANTDILFLSRMPGVLGMLNSFNDIDEHNYRLWKSRMEQTFSEFLINKEFYYQIRYIGIANNGQELVNVRNDSQSIVIPSSRLQQKSARPYFKATIDKDPGQVYFSKIELAKNYGEVEKPHNPVLRVATPIYHPTTGDIFGLIVININFGNFIAQLKNRELSQLSFYLTNEEGDFVSHPDNSKTFGFNLGHRYLIQDEFPQLKSVISEQLTEYNIAAVTIDEHNYLGHYQQVNLNRFDNIHQLNLLLLKDSTDMEQTLAAFRMRSLLLGSALALVALAIATIAARRIATPLQQITDSIENYDKYNTLSALPTKSNTEIGVLARSFSNLFTQMQFALREQEHSALLAKQSSEQIQAIFSSAAEGFITINEQGSIIAFNQAAQEMFGYSEAEALEQNVRTLMPMQQSTKHDGYLNQYKATGIAHIMGIGRKLRAQKKSGEIFPIHLSISKVTSEQGIVFTGIIRDISKEELLELEQEQHQHALMAVNERISLATDAAGIGIWQYDIANDKLSWDKWMHKIYATVPQEFSGNLAHWQKSVHPEDITSANQAVLEAIAQKTKLDDEFRIITPSGTIKHIKAMALIKLDSQGEAVQMIGVNFDITERKVVEQEHIAAKELAEDTARHKAEFLASMSHEIRTPMNGIIGMLGLLQRNELSEEQRHRVDLANSSAESLLTLINDILDFSKVEAGKLDLEVIDFDLRNLFGEFSESLALKSQEKNIEIILDNRGIQQSHVKGDPGRLRQILNNLTDNAIKFTNQGEIVITAKLTEAQAMNSGEENQLTLHCSISDTGIGIPSDQIAKLFQSFTQVDASTTRKYGGTGLGLAICKQLCQLMQGDIKVSSTVGQGSNFSFTVSLAKSKQARIVLPDVDINNVPMLIVDDNATNRLVLKAQLEHWGAIVYEADGGLSALALLENNAINQEQSNIKMAFLDMYMPQMDGATLAKKVKELPNLAELKLVMMTSMASRGDASYFRGLGFSAYFPKPAITEDLFKTLSLCLSQSTTSSAQLPLITHHYLNELGSAEDVNNNNDLSQCRLLLVEDNRINQEVARHILAEFGIVPDIAVNGLEALTLLNATKGQSTKGQTTPDEAPYDIILMDCQMPEMDGYQATAAIRQGEAGEKNKAITIIAMTANAMKGDREKCLAAGMTDYLSKPIEPVKLKEKLRQYLNLVIKTETISPAIPGKLAQELVTKTADKTAATNSDIHFAEEQDQEQLMVWHRGNFSKRLNNNEEFQYKLIALFIEETPKQFNALAQSIHQQDNKLQHEISHKIQGMSANLSAESLLKHTKNFNQYVKTSSPDNTQIDELFQAMQLAYQALEQELKRVLNEKLIES